MQNTTIEKSKELEKIVFAWYKKDLERHIRKVNGFTRKAEIKEWYYLWNRNKRYELFRYFSNDESDWHKNWPLYDELLYFANKKIESTVINEILQKLKEANENKSAYKQIIKRYIIIQPSESKRLMAGGRREYITEWEYYFMEYPDISIQLDIGIQKTIENGELLDPMILALACNFNGITEFGFKYLEKIEKSFVVKIEAYLVQAKQTINEFYLKNKSRLYKVISNLLIDSENDLRTIDGINKIGEDWIGETMLYKQITEKIHDKVIFHAKLPFLGRQHIDVFIPNLNTAIEYQGAQHFRPVEFFGGNDAYEKTKERDRRKMKLCLENNITLIYVE
jgi:hypothetical protein